MYRIPKKPDSRILDIRLFGKAGYPAGRISGRIFEIEIFFCQFKIINFLVTRQDKTRQTVGWYLLAPIKSTLHTTVLSGYFMAETLRRIMHPYLGHRPAYHICGTQLYRGLVTTYWPPIHAGLYWIVKKNITLNYNLDPGKKNMSPTYLPYWFYKQK